MEQVLLKSAIPVNPRATGHSGKEEPRLQSKTPSLSAPAEDSLVCSSGDLSPLSCAFPHQAQSCSISPPAGYNAAHGEATLTPGTSNATPELALQPAENCPTLTCSPATTPETQKAKFKPQNLVFFFF